MPLPQTWYKTTLSSVDARPSLAETIEVETVIVGGGLAGLTTALMLMRAGQSVAVLEAEETGFGASGRNGGFVSGAYALNEAAIIRKVGQDKNAILQALASEGVDIVAEEVAKIGAQNVDQVRGIINALRYEDDGALKARIGSSGNEKLEYLSRSQMQERLVSKRYYHGVLNHGAFHLNPLKYLRGLARMFEAAGGKIFDHSPVQAIASEGAEKVVSTAQGRVKAKNVVIATGGYTQTLVPKLYRAYLPIWTYVMVSECMPDLLATAIKTRAAVSDNRKAGDYYRLVEGGDRLLWGGRISTAGANEVEISRQLRKEMTSTFPQLSSLKTELVWSGRMSYARHQMPQIGRLSKGIWYCTAFGGHGLNTTAIGARVVAEDILGESRRIEAYADYGLPWAGGAIGLATAQMVYWKLQLQDLLAERKADQRASFG